MFVALKSVTKNRVRIAEKMLQNAGYTIYRIPSIVPTLTDLMLGYRQFNNPFEFANSFLR